MIDSTGDDAAFLSLAPYLRRRIDGAFDRAVQQISLEGFREEPARKRRKLTKKAAAPAEDGGFLLEDAEPGGYIPEAAEASGFMVDDNGDDLDDNPQTADRTDDAFANGNSTETKSEPTLDLSEIPDALASLSLPSDDEVLSVFHNAASGWGSKKGGQGGVSRKDWRAVCAVLLEGYVEEHDDVEAREMDDDISMADGSSRNPSHESEDEISGGEYDYMEEDEEGDDDSESDEYHEGPTKMSPATKSSGRKKRARAPSVASDDDAPRTLTSRDKRECRKAFSMFFPDVADSELGRQRIMIKEITNVAKLLKEKLKAEEIIEMLEEFSSSPDKSMNLTDFERMMITTALI